MERKTLRIAEEYTKFPAGRFKTDGPYSGERFREEFLVPQLKTNDKLSVFIDGVKGYGSSFLEEAFGGLVRESLFTQEELERKLEIKYIDDSFGSYESEIWEYIKDAR